jgi:hypothetical protein
MLPPRAANVTCGGGSAGQTRGGFSRRQVRVGGGRGAAWLAGKPATRQPRYLAAAPSIARMHAERVKPRGNAMVNERVAARGGELVVASPAAFAARIRGDIAKWKDLAERVNIRAEWSPAPRFP